MNDDKNFIEYEISGIDYPLEDYDLINLTHENYFKNENYFTNVNFRRNEKNHVLRFNFKTSISPTEKYLQKYECLCESIINNFIINLLIETNVAINDFYFEFSSYKFYDDYIELHRICFCENIEGKVNNIKQEQIQKYINDSIPIRPNDVTIKKLLKIVSIEDPVIKYFLIYSWLCNLCFGQRKAKIFIEQSDTYRKYGCKDRRDRTREDNKIENEDIYTYYRNLIGHSINDALNIDDKEIIAAIKTHTPVLLKILLEKIQNL